MTTERLNRIEFGLSVCTKTDNESADQGCIHKGHCTGMTVVAPRFSVALTLFQPGAEGLDSASQRSHQTFPHGCISAADMLC